MSTDDGSDKRSAALRAKMAADAQALSKEIAKKSDPSVLLQQSIQAFEALDKGKENPATILSRMDTKLERANMSRDDLASEIEGFESELATRVMRGTIRYANTAVMDLNKLPRNTARVNRDVGVASIRNALRAADLIDNETKLMVEDAEQRARAAGMDDEDVATLLEIKDVLQANPPRKTLMERMDDWLVKKSAPSNGGPDL